MGVPEHINYTCDNCGAEVSTVDEIPKCIGCGKELCEICHTYLLCPQDFHKLEKRDQKKIKKLGQTLENAHNAKVMFTVMPAILGILGAILLILMIIFQRDLFYFLFGFMGGFLLLSAGLMYAMFHNFEEREKKQIKQKIRALIIPYNIERVKRVLRPSVRPMKSIPDTQVVAQGEEKTVFCSSCGSEIRGSNLKYCEKCGVSLSQKGVL